MTAKAYDRKNLITTALLNCWLKFNIIILTNAIIYSYFMPVCSIVKTITPRCPGRPDAVFHEAEGFGQVQ